MQIDAAAQVRRGYGLFPRERGNRGIVGQSENQRIAAQRALFLAVFTPFNLPPFDAIVNGALSIGRPSPSPSPSDGRIHHSSSARRQTATETARYAVYPLPHLHNAWVLSL